MWVPGKVALLRAQEEPGCLAVEHEVAELRRRDPRPLAQRAHRLVEAVPVQVRVEVVEAREVELGDSAVMPAGRLRRASALGMRARPTTAQNASTTWGSNCDAGAAAQLLERDLGAHAGPVRPVRDHRVVGVADRDDARAERDALARAARPGSRSRPSARGSSARAARPRSARAPRVRMRSPITRVRAHEGPLLARSAGPACRGSSPGSPPCRCRAATPPAAAGRRPRAQAEPLGDRAAEAGHVVQVVCRARRSARTAPSAARRPSACPADARPRFFCAYMRRSAIRSADEGSRASLVGQQHPAAGGADAEAVAAVGQRLRRALDDLGRVLRRDRAPARRTRRRPSGSSGPRPAIVAASLSPEPLQQRVAGRVAVGVVVRLEAVEVEHREHERVRSRRGLAASLEVRHQAAPVAEPGERVLERKLLRVLASRPAAPGAARAAARSGSSSSPRGRATAAGARRGRPRSRRSSPGTASGRQAATDRTQQERGHAPRRVDGGGVDRQQQVQLLVGGRAVAGERLQRRELRERDVAARQQRVETRPGLPQPVAPEQRVTSHDRSCHRARRASA